MMNTRNLLLWALTHSIAAAGLAQGPPCLPCAGVRLADPATVLDALAAEPRLDGEARLYVAWDVELDGTADPAAMDRVLDQGGTPWAVVHLRTSTPVLEHIATFESELRDLARLAAGAGERAHFQLHWEPAEGEVTARELAFIVKRAAVAVTGSRPDARVLLGPLPLDPGFLRDLYAEEVAAYLDGIALPDGPATDLEAVRLAFEELDPGKGVVIDSLEWPEPATATLSRSAQRSAQGFAVTFFRRAQPSTDDLRPLKILAREFQGDLSLDRSTVPTGPAGAWTFVRGEDLSLRVIWETEPTEELELVFEDPGLKSPQSIDLVTGEASSIYAQRRTTTGLAVTFFEPPAVNLTSLERMTAAEMAGIAGLDERVVVEDERQMPVEEIVRRLQAFEDGQSRRLQNYRAKNTLHMRFNAAGGNPLGQIEVTFAGDFFFRQGEGFDWAWDELYFNGVKWKRSKMPEIPLIQPEKSAVQPVEITFGKEYRYRLRGTATVDGRDTWVVDFAPAATEDARVLSQGTVWIDRELYARVKTRAVQVGLEGEVISNEETIFTRPFDAAGEPTSWTADAYYLPARSVGQQLLSILTATVQVERETQLENVRLNVEDFDDELAAKYASEARMVRDTDKGLRYLAKDKETGERYVKDELKMTQRFIVAGAFYDAGLDFPVPLAGINILSRDWRGKGLQVNGFFAGPLIIGSLADPDFLGSKWDAGINIFGLAVSGEEDFFRAGIEQPAETVKTGANGRINLSFGRRLNEFWKLDFDAGARFESFSRADDTADDFTLPEDTVTTAFQSTLRYNRAGYRFLAQGSFNQRADWSFWGLPDNLEFDPEQEDYVRWRIGAGKTWWLPKFTKFGIDFDHLNGSDLDRFSKYDFDFFSESRVAGYQDGIVTAEEATGVHLVYGLDVGEVFRVQFQGDAVWASDEISGLEDELLAGISLNGTLIGPWGTIVNFDLGVPVEGPADDLVVFVAFLKLFE